MAPRAINSSSAIPGWGGRAIPIATVLRPGTKIGRDVELATDERTLHRTVHMAAHPDIGDVLDALEQQVPPDAGTSGGKIEAGAIPVFARQRLGDGEIVEATGWVRIEAARDQGRQHGAGYHRTGHCVAR